MKKLKKLSLILSLILICTFSLSSFSACGINSLEGVNVFMFKSTGNIFGDLMYKGFSEQMSEYGEKTVYRSPSEATVSAQIELLDTLILQKVKSITISASGITGYDQVFKKAKEAGIKVISVDAPISPQNRITHVDSCTYESIGSALVQAATLIVLGVPYPADGDMETATEEALKKYSGNELRFGILTAAMDTAGQNKWIEKMKDEVAKDMYRGKVNPYMEIKYGNDEMILSTNETNAFIVEDNVDIIIAPTTVAMKSAGQALTASKSKIKLTGLGLPSEMQKFMPTDESDNEFDFVCPYMFLWDVIELGAAASAVTYSVCELNYDGKAGSTVNYKGRVLETLNAEDGGTNLITLTPFAFHKGNIKDWINLL